MGLLCPFCARERERDLRVRVLSRACFFIGVLIELFFLGGGCTSPPFLLERSPKLTLHPYTCCDKNMACPE